MKSLNGAEIAEFIKERQAKQVRALKQARGIYPKLAIIRTNPAPVVDVYMDIKKSYGQEIGVAVDVYDIAQSKAKEIIETLNNDESVHGIIVQIPLPDPLETDEILNTVALSKDVDGLRKDTSYDAPTPLAIHWLLAGYNIDLKNKQIVIIGQGRLVGAPLTKLWQANNVTTADKATQHLSELTTQADIIVSATGKPGLLTASMVKPNAVIVDAGVATDTNGLVGDVAQDVRELPDIAITPVKGGVGPLTVAALFDNVLTSVS